MACWDDRPHNGRKIKNKRQSAEGDAETQRQKNTLRTRRGKYGKTGLENSRKLRSVGTWRRFFPSAEIMAVLYFEKMKIDPENPQWAERDRLVLSKGHATVALYPTLALEGIFSGKAAEKRSSKDRRVAFGARGNEECRRRYNVDRIAGPGLSAAVGMTGRENDGKRMHGLCNFGRRGIRKRQIWEAMMYGGSAWADNLVLATGLQ